MPETRTQPRVETETRVARRFDVWNEVPLVPQLTGMSCWAAAAAMIIGWRDALFVDPQEVASGSGTWESYRAGLHPADVDQLARAWGLTQERRDTWTVEALRRVLARHGPVWLGEASPGLHSIVVAGMHGDGTPDGTFVRVNDPWPVGKGERYTLPWRTLAANFRRAGDLIGVQAHVLHAGGRRRGASRSRVEERRVTRSRISLPSIAPREDAMIYPGHARRAHHEEYESASSGSTEPIGGAFDAYGASETDGDGGGGMVYPYGYVQALAVDDDVRAWLAAAPADRAPLATAAAAWIADTERSGIDLIASAARRRHFLSGVDWSQVDFIKNGQNRSAESEALFRAMAGPVPERRVTAFRYHDVEPVLVPVPGDTSHRLHPAAAEAFVRMRDAARADGVALRIGSSWRSLARQRRAAARNPNPYAVAQGISAHSYGLAVDVYLSVPGLRVTEISTKSMPNMVKMYRSPVYKWMALHAREHGFHPYRREPWHFEYNPDGFRARFEAEAGVSASGHAYGAPIGLFERYPAGALEDAYADTDTAVVPLVDERGAFALQAAPAAPDWCTMLKIAAALAENEERVWTRRGVKLLEANDLCRPALERYWSAVPGVNAVAKAEFSANDHAIEGPWSAAFICYAMFHAGIRREHGFVFSGAHISYIVGALRNRERSDNARPFWLLDPIEMQNETVVAPGDLLCMNREIRPGVWTTHSYQSLRRDFWENGHENVDPQGSSHCTMVVRIGADARGRFAETVGGNEGGSVRRSHYGRIPLNASGGIANPAAHRIFGMIKNIHCQR